MRTVLYCLFCVVAVLASAFAAHAEQIPVYFNGGTGDLLGSAPDGEYLSVHSNIQVYCTEAWSAGVPAGQSGDAQETLGCWGLPVSLAGPGVVTGYDAVTLHFSLSYAAPPFPGPDWVPPAPGGGTEPQAAIDDLLGTYSGTVAAYAEPTCNSQGACGGSELWAVDVVGTVDGGVSNIGQLPDGTVVGSYLSGPGTATIAYENPQYATEFAPEPGVFELLLVVLFPVLLVGLRRRWNPL